MSRDTLPGATDRALTLMLEMAAGQWEEARRDFGDKMRDGLGAGRLAEVWATVVGMIGAFERAGEPVAYPAPRGTVVDVPLYFEAGERTGRVSYDPGGRVIGLFIRPAAL